MQLLIDPYEAFVEQRMDVCTQQQAVVGAVGVGAQIRFDMGCLKYLDDGAAGHCTASIIGRKERCFKYALPLTDHYRPLLATSPILLRFYGIERFVCQLLVRFSKRLLEVS